MDYIKDAATKFCNAQPACSTCKYGDSGADDCLVMTLARAKNPEKTISDVMSWAKNHEVKEDQRHKEVFGDNPEKLVVAANVLAYIDKLLEIL